MFDKITFSLTSQDDRIDMVNKYEEWLDENYPGDKDSNPIIASRLLDFLNELGDE